MSSPPKWTEYVSQVRDQGDCGSCTGFGTARPWEARIRIKAGDPKLPVDLSEYDLFFGSGGTCEQGNTMEPVLNKALSGIAIEEDCPYVDHDPISGLVKPDDWWKRGHKLAGWTRLHNLDEIKKALENGPIVGTMAVHSSFFNYEEGVYESLGPWDPIEGYHCISLVYYSDELGALLISNSWNRWGFSINGISGYCWIKFGDSETSDEAYDIKVNGPIPQPEPTPSPCSRGNGIARKLNESSTLRQHSLTINRALNPFLWLLHRKGRFYSYGRRFHYLNPPR